MAGPEQQILEISSRADPGEARRIARTMALATGFDDAASEEIALVTSELATNLLKHANSGKLTLTPLESGKKRGLQIESRDQGPGIVDVDQALADGFSTSGSLGVGLGTVNRLMDEFDIESNRVTGTLVTCKRWIRSGLRILGTPRLSFGVATRPRPGMEANGDSFVVKQWDEGALFGVIDGVGHGQHAHRAAEIGRQYIESHFDQPLANIFRGVGYACRGSRGLVLALARFDWSPLRLSFASVGNIEVRVANSPEPFHYMIRRGIIGGNAPTPKVTTHVWDLHSVMVLHSDGLKTRWQWVDFPGLLDRPAADIAQKLLRSQAREEDDVTVLVVKGAESAR